LIWAEKQLEEDNLREELSNALELNIVTNGSTYPVPFDKIYTNENQAIFKFSKEVGGQEKFQISIKNPFD
jgi:hypothetical protein